MSLAAELQRFSREFAHRCSPRWLDHVVAAQSELDESSWADRVLRPPSPAPPFALESHRGAVVSLVDAVAQGPVVLSFFRGGWCPYCSLELREYRRRFDDFQRAGISVLAISGERKDRSRALVRDLELPFDVLTDVDLSVARAYGLTFRLPDAMKAAMVDLGHPLEVVSAEDTDHLIIPATFIVDRDGSIAAVEADIDYRRRWEPADVLASVRGLGR